MSLCFSYSQELRRGLMPLAVCLLMTLPILGGCGGPEATTQPAEKSEPRASRIDTKPVERSEDFVEAGAMPGRTHLVQPKETLYGLAQRYYGNKNQWRRIYYANRNRLTDPNDLPVGIRLIIP